MITLFILNLILSISGILHWRRGGSWFEEDPTFRRVVYEMSMAFSGITILFGVIYFILKYLP